MSDFFVMDSRIWVRPERALVMDCCDSMAEAEQVVASGDYGDHCGIVDGATGEIVGGDRPSNEDVALYHEVYGKAEK
jgi:hypothetical protein